MNILDLLQVGDFVFEVSTDLKAKDKVSITELKVQKGTSGDSYYGCEGGIIYPYSKMIKPSHLDCKAEEVELNDYTSYFFTSIEAAEIFAKELLISLESKQSIWLQNWNRFFELENRSILEKFSFFNVNYKNLFYDSLRVKEVFERNEISLDNIYIYLLFEDSVDKINASYSFIELNELHDAENLSYASKYSRFQKSVFTRFETVDFFISERRFSEKMILSKTIDSNYLTSSRLVDSEYFHSGVMFPISKMSELENLEDLFSLFYSMLSPFIQAKGSYEQKLLDSIRFSIQNTVFNYNFISEESLETIDDYYEDTLPF